ncbi:MAG: sirohydrochlorin cobaltochelatase [Anaerocolumna sp.]
MCKKGILVVSFGTSHLDTLNKTIKCIEEDVKVAYPEYKLFRAFTSKMIINILNTREQYKVYTVEEALLAMKDEGIEDVLVQPTHIINGIENDNMISDIMKLKEAFKSIRIGAPLLHDTKDYFHIIDGFMRELDVKEKDTAVVLMGHGTTHYSNTSYASLEHMFHEAGHEDVYIGTVEAYPEIVSIIKKLGKKSYKKVMLTPFMIVAGDHAKNDMAGDEEDSWNYILTKEGYEVECLLKGLGEYEVVRKTFIEHLKEAKEV